jgi:hypothetical protein
LRRDFAPAGSAYTCNASETRRSSSRFTLSEMSDFKAFIAGFLSTLVFHQGTLAILHAAGLTARKPYVATPTWPLHVPARGTADAASATSPKD